VRPIVVAVVLGLTLAAPRAEQTRFTSKVESVRIEVLATEHGRPVAGLTANDFEVKDNGIVQTVRLVDADTAPINLMIALDASASLSADRLERIRGASQALVRNLRPDESAGVIAFSHVVTQLQPMTLDRALIDKAFASIYAWGDTALIDATTAALGVTEDAAGRGLLVLFSDGVDTASWQSADAVVRSARRLETTVYAVSVAAPGQSPEFLREVASATGGKVFEVESNERLEAAFVGILNEFRQRYLLSYTPSGPNKAGWHPIDVRVKKRGVTVRARPGYFAK
jgi:VWFA-related protein